VGTTPTVIPAEREPSAETQRDAAPWVPALRDADASLGRDDRLCGLRQQRLQEIDFGLENVVLVGWVYGERDFKAGAQGNTL
jgi:hypothetical protein